MDFYSEKKEIKMNYQYTKKNLKFITLIEKSQSEETAFSI